VVLYCLNRGSKSVPEAHCILNSRLEGSDLYRDLAWVYRFNDRIMLFLVYGNAATQEHTAVSRDHLMLLKWSKR
jgi:hypothetical protein